MLNRQVGKQSVGLLASFVMLFATAPGAYGQSFDLGTSTASMQAPVSATSGMAAIRVGGRVQTFTAGSAVTPAQFTALQQVLGTGSQTLTVDAAGRAVGGRFSFDQIPQSILSSLIVPQGVTAIHDFASTNGAFQLAGNLTNAGSIYAVSTSANINSASLLAENIFNGTNALITSILPAGGLSGYAGAIHNLSLNLVANGSLVNHGVISSANTLTITTSGTIENSGLLQAANDINLRSIGTGSLSFINTGGNVVSDHGAINIGSSSTLAVDVHGGNFLSRELNVQAKDVANVNIGQVTGVVNMTAAELKLAANSDVLRLGNVCASGDPLIQQMGDVVLTSGSNIVTNGGPLSILAGGNITVDTSGGAVSINTGGPAGGGDVLIMAGADFTVDGSNNATIIGGTPDGGKIDLTGITEFRTSPTGADAAGGSVTLVAYGGSGIDAGKIILPAEIEIQTGGTGTGANGNFLAIASEIVNVSVNTTGGTGSGGSIGLYTTAPQFMLNGSPAATLSVASDGTLAPGSSIVPAATTINNGITVSKLTAAGNVDIRAGSILNNDAFSTTQNINIITSLLTNEGNITGANVAITSEAGQDLHIAGNSDTHSGKGTIKASGVLTFAATPLDASSDNSVIFDAKTHQSLTAAQTSIIANSLGANARVEIGSEATIHSHSPMTIYSQNLVQLGDGDLAGEIDGAPLKWISPTGHAVMSNPDGDLRLTSNIIAPGQNVTLLAAGNITSSSAFTKIDLSSKTGQSGSVLLIAGFAFEDAPTSDTMYRLTGPSQSGGSILLPNVNIITTNSFSEDDSLSQRSIAGDVTAVAHSGATNAGAIMLKNITARGNSLDARGGNVLLIGQGGIKTGDIDVGGTYSGSIQLIGGEPTITNGEMLIQKDTGSIVSGAVFTGMPKAGAGAAIETGKINVSTTFARSGNVTIATDSSILVKGNLTATGQRSLQHSSNATAGGIVSISSLSDNITVNGSIDVSGVKKIGEYTDDENGGANGGIVTISSPANILIQGSIKAVGGPTISTEPTGHAGHGGIVTINSMDVAENSMLGGTVQIGGVIDVHGSNGLIAGNGGKVTVNAGTLVVKGKTGGYSIDARQGLATVASGTSGTAGQITIDTYATQPIPTNFDLTSSKATQVALPGGKFTIGSTNPIKGFSGIPNGVAGGLIADANAPLKSGSFVEGDVSSTPQVSVTVHGGAQNLIELQSDEFGSNVSLTTKSYAPHTLITPAKAVALYQVSRSSTPATAQTLLVDTKSGAALDVNPNGSGPLGSSPAIISIDEKAVRNKFSTFVLDTLNGSGALTLQISGLRPVLDLSASTKTSIRGDISFTTPNAAAMLNLGAKAGSAKAPVLLPDSSVSTTATGSLVLGISTSSFKNFGTIETPQLILIASASNFTFDNSGTISGIGANPRITLNSEGVVSNITFKNIDGELSVPIVFESAQLPLAAGAAAQRTMPMGSPRNINIAFQMASVESNPLGQVLVPGSVSVQGDIHGDTVTLRTLSNKSGKVTVPTNIELDNASLHATKTVTISALGNIDISNSDISAGELALGVIPSTTLSTDDVISKGSITITAGNKATSSTLNLAANSHLTANGGDVKTISYGDINVTDPITVTANGGNIQMLALSDITGLDSNASNSKLVARAIGTTKSSRGGGVELGAGLTASSALNTLLKSKTPSGSTDGLGSSTTIGQGFINYDNIAATGPSGVLAVRGPASIDLTDNNVNDATIKQRGGAVLFNSPSSGSNSSIRFNGIDIETYGFSPFTPVAFTSSAHAAMALLNPAADAAYETDFGTVFIRKGGLAAIDREHNSLRVKACSGPGDVRFECGNRKFNLAPGQELTIGTSPECTNPTDGVGRRNHARYDLGNGACATISDFSIISLLRNADYLSDIRAAKTRQSKRVLDRMLKAAAAVQLASRTGNIRYVAAHK